MENACPGIFAPPSSHFSEQSLAFHSVNSDLHQSNIGESLALGTLPFPAQQSVLILFSVGVYSRMTGLYPLYKGNCVHALMRLCYVYLCFLFADDASEILTVQFQSDSFLLTAVEMHSPCTTTTWLHEWMKYLFLKSVRGVGVSLHL